MGLAGISREFIIAFKYFDIYIYQAELKFENQLW